MTVTQATKKQLFGASGNQCAFPNCNVELVDRDEEIVIGVIAHIHGKSPNGPRYDPDMTDEERDGFSNLMVLCPTHHARVDKNPEKYTAEKLKEWKEAHENSATPPASVPEHVLAQLESQADDPHDALESWTEQSHHRWEARVRDEFGTVAQSPYCHGYWMFSYQILEDFEPLDLGELRDLVGDVKGNVTGWPVWLHAHRDAKPIEGEVEAWLVKDTESPPSRQDFWRVSPEVQLFLLRGYDEDSPDKGNPGEVLDVLFPVTQIADCLLHSKRMAEELLDDTASVAYVATWTGLQGRRLDDTVGRRYLWSPDHHESHQDEITVKGTYNTGDLDEELPEMIKVVTKPLHQSFDFYELELDVIERVLEKLRI